MTRTTFKQTAAVFGAALGLGVTAGMRSQIPFALLALKVNRGGGRRRLSPVLNLLRRRGVPIGLGLSAVGEAVGDKLPFAPSRLSPGPLVGRIGFGAAAGAAVAHGVGGPTWIGSAAGASGAVAGALLGYTGRVQIGQASGLPDPALGVVEDAIAVGIGLLAIRNWPGEG